jgi:UDP-N-acetylmuramoyl-L-alanyl-D-glutamate--2,6-diaminopimelate ligase
MLDAGCDVVIVETTSEGIVQSRHLGIHYDVCVFTNLTPEHIESHGGFENYKNAKLELFRHLDRLPVKMLNGRAVEKVSVVNMDSEHGNDFLAVGNFRKVQFGSAAGNDVVIAGVTEQMNGTDFTLNGTSAHIPLLGAWNAGNAGIAAAVGVACGVELSSAVAALAHVEPVPGRMEFIDAGQPYGVIVDYAYEPVSLGLLFTFARKLAAGHRVITLISSTGGGRDVRRRAPNGRVAGELCDLVIVTDEDPYDENPQTIIDQVADGVRAAGKVEGENFWRVLSRRDGIRKAVELAQPGDVVLLTCKGAEQKMAVANGKKIPWDDRKYVREDITERMS